MRTAEEMPAQVLVEVVRGLMLMLGQTFALTEGQNLFYSQSTTKAIQAYQQKLKATGQPLTWPMMYVKLTNATSELANPGYNMKSLARHGVYVTKAGDKNTARKLSVQRVDMEFEVNFLVDKQELALGFVADWLTLGKENRLNFTVNYYGLGIDMGCRLSSSVTVPDREASVDEAMSVFEFTAGIMVEGWVTATHVDSDTEVPLVRKLNIGITPVEDTGNTRVVNAALAYRRE